MYEEIEMGLEAYKAKLVAYKLYTDGLKKKYGEKLALVALEDPDYGEVLRQDAFLKGMEAALGLTKDEIEAIGAEFGITPK